MVTGQRSTLIWHTLSRKCISFITFHANINFSQFGGTFLDSERHIKLLIRLQMKTTPKPGLRQTYVNLKNANWDRYRLEVEAALSKRSLPTDCQRDEKILRTILLKAASHHIPTGRHRLHEEPVPAEILDVMTRRDDLRKRDRTSPELPRLNKDIQKRICEHKRQKLTFC